ncbi:TauD/TfdA family dioxygenase [Streptomyces sp. NBC_00006]|uniref:TauD/TfdA family dioxygenase n=1 Tax=Streptomyces sp. NBC_00006 TaxID=2975619 RepID=UPI0022590F97|nr:TauD/TfdA family dioxygenase [Streptomyces sp. NBC_00006]MCX5532829.1 TauD/TfdA family dioxygenase [Streptomyces sp. NBC_00006]
MTVAQHTLRLTAIGDGDGMMITPTGTESDFTEMYQAGLDGLLADTGHLLIRGFAPGVEEFNELVRRYSSRTTMDPARTSHGNAAQKVDSGRDPIGLHLENGATPFAPDLLWFHCVKAATSGSETTVCDGFRVWDALSERARKVFAGNPVKYVRSNVPRAMWQRLAAHLTGPDADPADMTVEHLQAVSNKGADVVFTEATDGTLTYEYTVYAAHPTRGSSRTAWANSILGPSFNYEAPEIRFADGSLIPDDVIAEYAEVTEKVTEEIQWEDGDIVLIDNTRVMHGRRAITDPERTILNAQSYARS